MWFRNERGQVAPLMAITMVAAGFCCLVVVRFGVAALERAHARTAADAAALAGAAAGRDAAVQAAGANGGRILRYLQQGSDVLLRVGVDTAAATAKAHRDGIAGDSRIAPAMRAVLARAAQLLGHDVPVRAVRDQGLAVEVSPDVAARLRQIGPQAGLCQPDPGGQPFVFDVCPAPPTATP